MPICNLLYLRLKLHTSRMVLQQSCFICNAENSAWHAEKVKRSPQLRYCRGMAKEHISKIYTIGHSTRSEEEFLGLLRDAGVTCLVDVRRHAGSRKFPQFNPGPLEKALNASGIAYRPMVDLGGRRKVHEHSTNTAWRNASFQGYADYMETADFDAAYASLVARAEKECVALMCAEAVWWRCHRSMIADRLKAEGWTVCHILGPGQIKEHPYTSPARVVDGNVVYSPET